MGCVVQVVGSLVQVVGCLVQVVGGLSCASGWWVVLRKWLVGCLVQVVGWCCAVVGVNRLVERCAFHEVVWWWGVVVGQDDVRCSG